MANSKYAAFIAAAEEGNMTAAAQKLGYTQSGVSHLVHTLEQELGVQLLIRSKAGVELSPEGNALIGHIRRLIAAENAVLGAAEELRGVERGTLRIGTFSSGDSVAAKRYGKVQCALPRHCHNNRKRHIFAH